MRKISVSARIDGLSETERSREVKKMQCREFREISDSYLSDELLVETNHQIYRHIESCSDCRADFAARRGLRQKLKAAVRNADEFQMDQVFANKLKIGLKEAALYENAWKRMLLRPKLIVPVLASLLVTAALGVVFFNFNTPDEIAKKLNTLSANDLTDISLKAVLQHEDCALEKLTTWEALSKQESAERAAYTEKVLKPLDAGSSGNVVLLHAHDCIFEGKTFTHVVLKDHGKVVSVFFDKSEELTARPENAVDPIMSEKLRGMQVASFRSGSQVVFVVSEMSESENVRIARILSDSWRQRADV